VTASADTIRALADLHRDLAELLMDADTHTEAGRLAYNAGLKVKAAAALLDSLAGGEAQQWEPVRDGDGKWYVHLGIETRPVSDEAAAERECTRLNEPVPVPAPAAALCPECGHGTAWHVRMPAPSPPWQCVYGASCDCTLTRPDVEARLAAGGGERYVLKREATGWVSIVDTHDGTVCAGWSPERAGGAITHIPGVSRLVALQGRVLERIAGGDKGKLGQLLKQVGSGASKHYRGRAEELCARLNAADAARGEDEFMGRPVSEWSDALAWIKERSSIRDAWGTDERVPLRHHIDRIEGRQRARAELAEMRLSAVEDRLVSEAEELDAARAEVERLKGELDRAASAARDHECEAEMQEAEAARLRAECEALRERVNALEHTVRVNNAGRGGPPGWRWDDETVAWERTR
jgi:hypothetical protein